MSEVGHQTTTKTTSSTSTSTTKEEFPRDGLGPVQFRAYAVGHFANDLCSCCWFTYVLYFVNQVVGLSKVESGFVMLSGQIADGITTPIVGILSDKFNTRFGRRTPWYVFGTFLVIPTFFGIFNGKFTDETRVAWYCALPALFNVGWAAVQISNMAIVNELTFSTERRDVLVSLRNGATFISCILVLIVALICFATIHDQVLQFRVLSWIIVLLGLGCSAFYLYGIREKSLGVQAMEMDRLYWERREKDELEQAKEVVRKAKEAARQIQRSDSGKELMDVTVRTESTCGCSVEEEKEGSRSSDATTEASESVVSTAADQGERNSSLVHVKSKSLGVGKLSDSTRSYGGMSSHKEGEEEEGGANDQDQDDMPVMAVPSLDIEIQAGEDGDPPSVSCQVSFDPFMNEDTSSSGGDTASEGEGPDNNDKNSKYQDRSVRFGHESQGKEGKNKGGDMEETDDDMTDPEMGGRNAGGDVNNEAGMGHLSSNIVSWTDWLSEGTFYVHGMVYMLVRIALNVTISLQPFYLLQVTGFEVTEDNPTPLPIALVPLISYLFSTVFSIFMYTPMLKALKSRFAPMFVAIIVITISSFPMAFLTSDPNIRWLMYFLAGIQGVGLAIMINTATSLISDVIGSDDDSSAFVYGAYSLFDKLANGIILFLITATSIENETALRWEVSIIPILCAIGAFGFTYLGHYLYSHRMVQISEEKVERRRSSRSIRYERRGSAASRLST